jgi:hypothetical protein
MIGVSIKVGSEIRLPVGRFALSSSDTGILQVSQARGIAAVRGLAVGKARLILVMDTDLTVDLDVSVTP